MTAVLRSLSGVVIVIAPLGCATVPPSPVNEPLIRVSTDQGVRVTGPTFEIDFAATGIPMPERLMVNGVDVLGADDPCSGESRVGIAVWPAVQVSGGSPAGTLPIGVLASGPAMAKVQVPYEINYACPNSERLTGTTVFTILPGGRIVREDKVVQPSTNTLSFGASCGCRSATDVNLDRFHFSSFWAFNPAGATQVAEDGTEIVKDTAVKLYKACTMYDQRAIGVAWTPDDTTSTRFRSDRVALHALDFPTTDNNRMLDNTPQSMTSAIQIYATPPEQPSDCAKVLALLDDVPLTIGAMSPAYTAYDGIYRDSAIHDEAFDIVAGEYAVPAGFAISVDLGGADHAIVTREDGTEPEWTGQRESDSRFLMVFEEGLAPGKRLRVEPRR